MIDNATWCFLLLTQQNDKCSCQTFGLGPEAPFWGGGGAHCPSFESNFLSVLPLNFASPLSLSLINSTPPIRPQKKKKKNHFPSFSLYPIGFGSLFFFLIINGHSHDDVDVQLLRRPLRRNVGLLLLQAQRQRDFLRFRTAGQQGH